MSRLSYLGYVLFTLIVLNPFFIQIFLYGYENLKFNFSIFSFYPILFLPLFVNDTTEKKPNWFQFGLGSLFLFFVVKYFSLNFFYLSSILMCFSFLPYLGVHLSNLGFILFLLCPPFLEKYDLLISFELRLFLSDLTGSFISIFDSGVVVNGNEIIYKGIPYIIDPACEGLRFFVAVILLYIIFYFYYIRKEFSLFKIGFLILAGIFFVILWLWANLLRILILIVFGISSTSPLHGAVGIFVFLFLIIIPYTLAWLHFIREELNLYFPTITVNKRFFILYLLPILLFCFNFYRASHLAIPNLEWKESYGEFKLDQSEDLESKFYRNKKATFILKKNLPIFGLGHHPKICFEALGYVFHSEEEIRLEKENTFRLSVIEKDKRKYFLSWWYIEEGEEKEKIRTSSELTWRKQSLSANKAFVLVNLITDTKKDSVFYYKELSKKGL